MPRRGADWPPFARAIVRARSTSQLMKNRKASHPLRRSRIEPLETRIAPAVAMTSMAGVVSFITDGTDDALTLSVNAAGFLTHSLYPTDQRYESATDLDPAPGIQELQLTAISMIDIAPSAIGSHDITLGDAQASWSFGATNVHIQPTGGGGVGRISLAINNAANTGGEVVTFGASTVSGSGGGAGKVVFQDIHFIKFSGGSGEDEIEIDAAPVELQIDGGAGNDHVHVAMGSLTQKVMLSDLAGAEDALEIEGTDQADDITIDEGGVHRVSELIAFSPASGLESISVDGGAGGDKFHIVKMDFPSASLAGGAGDDSFYFHKHITASVDGGEDSDSIFIKFDQADSSARVTVHDTGAAGYDFIKFEGSALADEFAGIKGELRAHKLGTETGAALYIKFDGIEGETVAGGDGGDRFVIKGSTGDLQLDGAAGDDEYWIKFDGREQHITLEPSPGGATGAPDADSLTVLGTDRSDSIAFHHDGITDGNGAYIKFDGAAGACATWIKFDGAKGNDRFFIDAADPAGMAPAAQTSVLGGAGNDAVTIISAPGSFSVDGGAGSDTVVVQFAELTAGGNLTDSGKTGTDRLFVHGTSRNDSFVVDGSDPAGILIGLSKAANAIQFLKFESFAIEGGAGDDEALFHTIKLSGIRGRFDGGFGHDRVTVSGDHEVASLILDGGEDSDDYVWESGGIKGLIRIADSGSGEDGIADDGDSFTVLGTARNDVIKFGGGSASVGEARLSYGKIEVVKIDAAAGDDLITIKGSNADCDDLEVLGGDGNDTITSFIKLHAEPANDYAALLLPAVQKVALEGAGAGGGPHVRILGGADNDTLIGGAGAESFDGGAGDDTIKAGGGNDRISGGAGINSVDGGAGIDVIVESADADFIFHKAQLTADHKADIKFDGTDRLAGIESFEVTGGDVGHRFDFSGFTGRVVARGGAGADEFLGGTGDDTFTGGLGHDKFDGGGGYNEVAEEGDLNFTVTGDGKTGLLTGLGDDTLLNIALVTITGGASANFIDGTKWKGDLIASGGEGDDHLLGGEGSNTFLGGDGDDTIAGKGSKNLLVEVGDTDFVLSATSLSGRGADVFSGIDAALLIGGESDNSIDATGFTGTVRLAGLAGDDQLTAGFGKSVLEGGLGDDLLTGVAKLTKFIGGPGKNTIVRITQTT